MGGKGAGKKLGRAGISPGHGGHSRSAGMGWGKEPGKSWAGQGAPQGTLGMQGQGGKGPGKSEMEEFPSGAENPAG